MLKYFDILMGVEFFQDPRENLISLIIKKKKKKSCENLIPNESV